MGEVVLKTEDKTLLTTPDTGKAKIIVDTTSKKLVTIDDTGARTDYGFSTDEKVKITSADTNAGYLNDKLKGSSSITLTKENAGADEDFKVELDSTLKTAYDGAVTDKHTHSNKTALDNVSGVNSGDQDISGKLDKNTAITGATKTKITYDSNGLVTSGADATTADIADSLNSRYVTDAQKTIIGNTSGTNSGDETSSTIISKIGSPNLYHGVVSRPVGASNPLPLNITTTTFTLGCLANPMSYYYQGQLVNVTTDKTVTLTDGTAGFYFVYFNTNTGNILATKNFPGLTITSNVIIASVFWNGTDYGLVYDERHSHDRDKEWHTWAHNTIGCRYRSGITLTHNSGTGAGATFATTSGEIADEDIQFVIDARTTARLLWQTGASAYSFNKILSSIPFNCGVNFRPRYVNGVGYLLTEASSAVNRYFNFFVYATTSLECPIYIFTETLGVTAVSSNGYTNLANARAIPFPNLSGFGLSAEMKPIYRIIVRADGVVQALDTTLDDYRTVSSLPMASGNVSTTASAVTVNPVGNISATNVQSALEELDTEKQVALGFTPANDTLSNIGITSINADLFPAVTNTRDIGTALKCFKDIYTKSVKFIHTLNDYATTISGTNGNSEQGYNLPVDGPTLTTQVLGISAVGNPAQMIWKEPVVNGCLVHPDASSTFEANRGFENTTYNRTTSIGTQFPALGQTFDSVCAFGQDGYYSSSSLYYLTSFGNDNFQTLINSTNNCVFGVGNGYAVTSLSYSTIIGEQNCSSSPEVNNSVIVGTGAVSSTVNILNYTTAIGNSAGVFLAGSYNVAIGAYSGPQVSEVNTNHNIHLGNLSGGATTGGLGKTNIGYSSGKFSDGNYGIFLGYQAGPQTIASSGADNIAIGRSSMPQVTTGLRNIGIGPSTLNAITTQSSNTAVGYSALSTNTFATCTGIGNNAQVTAASQVQLGGSGTTTYAYGAVQDRSDIRDKADIRNTTLGLDFICALRPVEFKWDMRDDYRPEQPEQPQEPIRPSSEELMPQYELDMIAYKVAFEQYKTDFDAWIEACKFSNITTDGSKKRTRFHQGLIAQEVKTVMDSMGVDFAGYQDHSLIGGDDVKSIGYTELIAPMIKAIQELTIKNKALEDRIILLESK
jgi:hypothetical protein